MKTYYILTIEADGDEYSPEEWNAMPTAKRRSFHKVIQVADIIHLDQDGEQHGSEMPFRAPTKRQLLSLVRQEFPQATKWSSDT